MSTYIFVDPEHNELVSPLNKWSEGIGRLSTIPHEFMVVLFSHHIECVIIYTNIKPHTSYNEYPLLDENFRAQIYLAADQYIDHCLQTISVKSASKQQSIIQMCNRLKQLCHDYT